MICLKYYLYSEHFHSTNEETVVGAILFPLIPHTIVLILPIHLIIFGLFIKIERYRNSKGSIINVIFSVLTGGILGYIILYFLCYVLGFNKATYEFLNGLYNPFVSVNYIGPFWWLLLGSIFFFSGFIPLWRWRLRNYWLGKG